MNDREFCFILCVSDELYREECLTYLRALEVPEGYGMDILTIAEAPSMCAGYNAGMRASDAKYKIYLHQDVFIRERTFLSKLLDIFADPTIGMLGMVGTELLSEDGVMWNGPRAGAFPGVEEMVARGELADFEVLSEGIRDVMAVDGLLIATQYDVPWREELFDGWDFYDVSQSLEFRREGYRVVVTAQRPRVWYQHDAVTLGLDRYEHYREIFLRTYQDMLPSARKRILYPLTKRIRTWDIPYTVKRLGLEPLLTDMGCEESSAADIDVDRMSRSIRELHADAVMTHDFLPFAARACAENGIPYIAWVWDAIQAALYDDSIRLPESYIFDFDRQQAEDTRGRGSAHVYYQPLAANTDRLSQIVLTEEDVERYACDISFIGSLYSAYEGYRLPEGVTPDTVREVEAILTGAMGHWDGSDRFTGRLSEAAVADIAAHLPENPRERRLIGERRYVEQTALARRLAYLERMRALEALAGRGDVRLYTWEGERGVDLPGIRVLGSLASQTELPRAYRLSRINLNLTLPSIRTGVPLRIFDILGAGGFVLTNHQEELPELFSIGEELEVFHSLEELVDKADYYLAHEEARARVAARGCRRVQEDYSYERQMARILSVVSEDRCAQGKEPLL